MHFQWYQLPLQLSPPTGNGVSHKARALLEQVEVLREFDPIDTPRLYEAIRTKCTTLANRIFWSESC